MELKKHIIDEKTEISYTLCGDYGPVKIYAQNCLQAPAE